MWKVVSTIFILTSSVKAFYFLDEFPVSRTTPLPYILKTRLPASPEDIRYYMEFAGASYCEQSTRYGHFNCPWCGPLKVEGYEFHARVVGHSTDTIGLITKNRSKNEVVLAFRGSLNLPNVVLDFLTRQIAVDTKYTSVLGAPVLTNVPKVYVHSGYWAATSSMYVSVLANLLTLASQNYSKLVITGHSLGGSIAALTLFRLDYEKVLPPQFTAVELYTYGQPRPGNQGFADYINNLDVVVSRTVNEKDIVPHTPIVAMNYYHLATEYWIQSESPYHGMYANRTIYEDSNLSNSVGLPFTAANLLNHATYFDINVLQCVALSPNDFIKQVLVSNPWLSLSD